MFFLSCPSTIHPEVISGKTIVFSVAHSYNSQSQGFQTKASELSSYGTDQLSVWGPGGALPDCHPLKDYLCSASSFSSLSPPSPLHCTPSDLTSSEVPVAPLLFSPLAPLFLPGPYKESCLPFQCHLKISFHTSEFMYSQDFIVSM